MDINSSRGMSHGATIEKLSAVEGFRESALFSDRERAALGFAEAVSRTPTLCADTSPRRRSWS
jgi:alkylhydroperoxidase family enzyme